MRSVGHWPILMRIGSKTSSARRRLLSRGAAMAAAAVLARPFRALALAQEAASPAASQEKPPPTVEQRIRHMIVVQLGADEKAVVPEAKLADLGADSLDVIELVMVCEEAFDIEISDEEIDCGKNWKTMGDMIHTVQGQLAKKQAASKP